MATVRVTRRTSFSRCKHIPCPRACFMPTCPLRLPRLFIPRRLRMDGFLSSPCTNPYPTLLYSLLRRVLWQIFLGKTLCHVPHVNHPINPHTCQALQIEAVEPPRIIGRTTNTRLCLHIDIPVHDTNTNLDHSPPVFFFVCVQADFFRIRLASLFNYPFGLETFYVPAQLILSSPCNACAFRPTILGVCYQ